MRRWTLPLYVLLAVLYIAPVWSVRYLPTGDGATHVYNAWVLHELAFGNAPPNIEAAYRIDWAPHPNWSGHALMALLMFVVSPLVAEKLLLTLVFVLLFTGAWQLCTAVDPRNEVYAFFVFPFAYAQHLISGYYNYALSVGLFLLILALWWRRRNEKPSVLVAVLLVVCYFTHPMATVLACAAIGAMAVLLRRFAHLVTLIPAAALLVLFGRTGEAGLADERVFHIDWEVMRVLGTGEVVQGLSGGQRPIGIAVTVLFAILTVVTLIRDRHRPANALAFVVLAFIAGMMWLPAPSPTRDLFSQRTSQFLFPLLAAWLTPKISERWRAALAGVLTVIALADFTIIWQHFRSLGTDNARFVRALGAIEPNRRLLPLLFEPVPSGTLVPVFVHRISYVALKKHLVDYANYEPASNYFPIAWREPVDTNAIELAPRSIDIAKYADRADYIATWGLPEDSPQSRDLHHLYVLIAEQERMRLYRRKAPLQGSWDMILLPFLGTRTDLGAPAGARWRIDQQIRNKGTAEARVVFRDCLDDTPCELALAANSMVPVATDERRFTLINVPSGTAPQLDITTVVRRSDVDRPDLSIHLPAVHESAFFRQQMRIENIPVRHRKIGLRLYLFTSKAYDSVPMRLRSRETGAIVGQREVEMAGFSMHENADLRTDFGDFNQRAEFVDVEIDPPPGARIWAFVTSTNESGQTHVHLPVSH